MFDRDAAHQLLQATETRTRLEDVCGRVGPEDADFLRSLAAARYVDSICLARVHVGGGVTDVCGRPRDDGHRH